MMRVAVVTPVWGRKAVTLACLNQWQTWRHPQFLFEFAVVWSPDDPELADTDVEAFGYVVQAPNQPLGDKFNAGVRFALRNLDFDYLMILGSDTLVLPSIFDDYLPHMQAWEEYIGVLDLYCADIESGDVIWWAGYPGERRGQVIGPGRCLSVDMVESLDGCLYEPLEKGLDWSMDQRMPAPVSFSSRPHFLTSIKTPGSITPLNHYIGATTRRVPDTATTFLAEQFGVHL